MIGKLIDALLRWILPPDSEPRPFDDGEILVRRPSDGSTEEANRA